MKFNYFDIETTGLTTLDTQFVLGVFKEGDQKEKVFYDLDTLFDYAKDIGMTEVIVGANTTNFDFPYLRTKYLLNGWEPEEWPFSGKSHFDLLNVFKYHFKVDETIVEPYPESRFKSNDLKKLAFLNDIEYQNMKQVYTELQKLENPDWSDYKKEKTNKYGDLQSLYQTFFDKNKEEEYLDGAEMPELYRKGRIDLIEKHCIRDVQRLKKVTELLYPLIPAYSRERAMDTL